MRIVWILILIAFGSHVKRNGQGFYNLYLYELIAYDRVYEFLKLFHVYFIRNPCIASTSMVFPTIRRTHILHIYWHTATACELFYFIFN